MALEGLDQRIASRRGALIYTGPHDGRGARPPSELCCWQPCRVFLFEFAPDSLAMDAMTAMTVATEASLDEEVQVELIISELPGSYGSILLGTFGGLL